MPRPNRSFKRFSAGTFALTGVALVASCGGGDDDSTQPTVAPTLLTGVVASGAASVGASISVVDSDIATADPAPVIADANGNYTINVTGLRAPLLVKATAIVEGVSTQTVAVVPSLTPNATNTANVTPLTNAVAALIAPSGDPLSLLVPATLTTNATALKVSNASALVVNTLQSDPAIAAALGTGFDPLTTAFVANGSGVDAVLDHLDVAVSSTGVSITNLSAPLSSTGVPVPVTLTAAQTATPTVAPSLPTSSAPSSLPTASDLAALGAKFQACLALPLAQRVTLDSAGIVTAVSAACNYAPIGWKSNGRTWAQEVGQFTFADDLFAGAKVGKGIIALTTAAENLTDPKEFKHPYCNAATCVVVRFPLTTASNQSTASDWVIAKVGTSWDFVGNQRPYRTFAEPRLNRKLATNAAGAAPGTTTEGYFFKDRYESAMRLFFDLNSPASTDIRAARFTGPGLPTAGVVLFRSQRCGTDDRLAIVQQNGSTRTNTNSAVFQTWTSNSAADFILDAANLDGTALTMPTPVLTTSSASNQEFSAAAIANQLTSIPAWSRFKIELFHFSALSDTPDEILYVRINAPSENAALGTTKQWPTLAQTFVDAYLKPSGASAGTISTLTPTLSWTTPTGTYVGSGYRFAQNFATVTNSESESSSYGLRTRLDFEPDALGNLTATARGFASVVSGTSLSPSTASTGTNPNPRCTSTNLVPLTTKSSDYREAGLSFRNLDRKLYNAIWFWDN